MKMLGDIESGRNLGYDKGNIHWMFGFIEFWVEFLPSAVGEILKLQLIGMQLPGKLPGELQRFERSPFVGKLVKF